MHRFRIGVALLVMLGVAHLGCGPCAATGAAVGAKKDDAQQVAERYFELAGARNWEEIEGLYHPRFFEAMPLDLWQRILPNVERELGPIQSCELQNWAAKQHLGTDLSGTYFTFVYNCEHERYENEVSFTVFGATGEDAFAIIGQNFNSIGFLVE